MADYWDSLVDTGSQAMNWLEENPNAANFITGAAVASINYASGAADRDAAKQLARDEREERKLYGGSSTSTEDSGYQLSLTEGTLAPGPSDPGSNMAGTLI